MAITLRQIQAFLAVTEQGTFTKAAERLNMAQPALSQLVRDLERELGIRVIETVCIASYDYDKQGEISVLKRVASDISGDDKGKGVLIVDDLVDTGATARVVREMMPQAHFATVYAKPSGRPLVDTFVTEVSQDTWIYLPWDMDLQFAPPIRERATA